MNYSAGGISPVGVFLNDIRTMDEKTLMMRLHLNNMRQGPGSDDATNLALNLAGIDRSKFYRVADIGCGTGAQTMALAASLKPTRFSRTARSMFRRRESKPVAERCGTP